MSICVGIVQVTRVVSVAADRHVAIAKGFGAMVPLFWVRRFANLDDFTDIRA